MKKNLSKRKLFVAALLLMTSLVFSANAAGSKVFAAAGREISVSTADEFAFAAKSLQDGDVILIKDNITLSRNIVLDKSVTVDLNGHTLSINNNGSLQCGYYSFDHQETYNEYHEGYWYDEKSTIEHPGYGYTDKDGNQQWCSRSWEETVKTKKWHDPWTETKTRDIYKCHDEIKISIKNGSILHSDGANGKNKEDGDYYGSYSGTDGEDQKNETLRIISGKTYLSNIDIHGGNGGNGGNGACYTGKKNKKIIGNGGNGGDGGNVFYIDKGSVIISKDNCHVFPGKGGNGGKGAVKKKKNKVVLQGEDGCSGNSGEISNKRDNVYFLTI